jgi:hypothetical protein
MARSDPIWAPFAVAVLVLAAGCRVDPPFDYVPALGPVRPTPPGLPPPDSVSDQRPAPTQAEFRNVDFRFDEDLVLRIRHLRGEMRGRDGAPVVFDEPDSFVMHLSEAEAAMDGRSLTALMRRYVFGYPGAPIRDLVVEPDDSVLVQTGILHKVIDIPFEMRARVTATPDGWIRIRPVAMKIGELSGLGLMDALGVELDDLMDLEDAPSGIRVEGNDLFLEPLEVLPAPENRGRLVAVRLEGEEMVLTFGPEPVPAPRPTRSAGTAARRPPMPLPDAPNYMYFWGGVLGFGKLFMPEADMMVVDDSPADPFDFFLELYNRQLVAGFTRNHGDYGLEVHMVDYAKLPAAPTEPDGGR